MAFFQNINNRLGKLNTAARESATAKATAKTNPNTAPEKTPSAPKGDTQNVYTGLCEALNSWQNELVKSGLYGIADEYRIVFAPQTMANAELKKPGTATNKDKTPMQQGTTAKGTLDPETNSVNVRGRTVAAAQGTQIIQFIDQVMRGSTYITEQQIWQNNENTQEPEKNANAADRSTAWYKISVLVESLGLDKKRNDQAYRMTYIVSPYGINESPSQYFPKTSFRGVHKSYNYWFTGRNNAILNYEQNINNQYYLTVSETLPDVNISETNSQFLYQRSWGTRSEQSDQQADGNANEPAANLADFLYNQQDFINIRLKIIGDPAWLQQGEVSGGLTQNNFSFSAFNNDDGINFEASEVCFDVTFNQPEDYDLQTGIMEVNGNKRLSNGTFGRNYPQQNQTYKAIRCRSTFSKGRFEQELEGQLLTEILRTTPQKVSAENGRATQPPAFAQAEVRQVDNALVTPNNEWTDVNGVQVLTSDITPSTTETPEADATPQLLNAPPPEPPTSSGDIDYSAGLAGADQGVTTAPAPPTADIANSPNEGVKEKLAAAANYEQRAAAARAAGDVYNATTLDRLATQARANAAADAKYGAPPVVKPAQLSNRET